MTVATLPTLFDDIDGPRARLLEKHVAKITRTQLGYSNDHGIFTIDLTVDYGGSGQSIIGLSLDQPIKDAEGKFLRREGTAYGMEFLARVIKAVGATDWEDVKGRTIYVLKKVGNHGPGSYGAQGIENLPTEPGNRLIFRDVYDEFEARENVGTARSL